MVSEHETERGDGLDAFFDAARGAPGPGADLTTRVLADAAQVQADAAAVPSPRRTGVLQALGGWITVSGLAAACAAGVAIGVTLPTLTGSGIDAAVTSLWQEQEAVGFANFDAVAFAEGGIGE